MDHPDTDRQVDYQEADDPKNRGQSPPEKFHVQM